MPCISGKVRLLSFFFPCSLCEEQDEEWVAVVTPSGHVGPVMDLTWDESGRYLISTRSSFSPLLSLTSQSRSNHSTFRPMAASWGFWTLFSWLDMERARSSPGSRKPIGVGWFLGSWLWFDVLVLRQRKGASHCLWSWGKGVFSHTFLSRLSIALARVRCACDLCHKY